MGQQMLSVLHFAKEAKGFCSKLAHYVERNHLKGMSTKDKPGYAANQDFDRVRHGLAALVIRCLQKETVDAPVQNFAPKAQHRDA